MSFYIFSEHFWSEMEASMLNDQVQQEIITSPRKHFFDGLNAFLGGRSGWIQEAGHSYAAQTLQEEEGWGPKQTTFTPETGGSHPAALMLLGYGS